MSRFTLCLALLALALHCQTRDLRIESIADYQKGAKVALVVGVGAYPEDSGLAALKYPLHDAEALAAELAKDVQALLLVSRAQNPIGAALDGERAAELQLILERHPELLVIEDDHASEVAGSPYRSATGPTAVIPPSSTSSRASETWSVSPTSTPPPGRCQPAT